MTVGDAQTERPSEWVVLWAVDLAAVDETTGPVTSRELARARRMRSALARRRFIARRRVTRTVLAGACASSPHALTLERRCAKCGGSHPASPLSAGDGRLWWSSSSSHDAQVLALASSQVGVDVEAIDGSVAWQAIARRFFTTAERRAIGGSVIRFFEFWTLKEAFLKATGVGLAGEMRALDCSTLETGSSGWRGAAAHPGWRFRSFTPSAGLAGALAVREGSP